MHMWQYCVEIKDYSLAEFNHTVTFEVPHWQASIEIEIIRTS